MGHVKPKLFGGEYLRVQISVLNNVYDLQTIGLILTAKTVIYVGYCWSAWVQVATRQSNFLSTPAPPTPSKHCCGGHGC